MTAEEVSPQEVRIRSLTRLYYSKPAVQQALLEFSRNREVVPRYFESFGKRPDTLQYQSDIMGLVSRGATSFHGSEEIWHDPLQITNEMNPAEFSEVRQSWDLLVDIDSPYLDYSKKAAQLIIELLERFHIQNYGIKFSGNKGFHIIVPGDAFPLEHAGVPRNAAFPDWPRAVTEFMLHTIRPSYNRAITELGFNVAAIQKKTNLSREDLVQSTCPNPHCGSPIEKHTMVKMQCTVCQTKYERPDVRITKRKLRCINDRCSGFFEIISESEFWKCPKCGFSSVNKGHDSENKVVYASKATSNYAKDFEEQIAADKLGSLDLVLVSPRHLFRMPYSLHEKTSLASVVLSKQQLATFTPKDADPMTVNPRPYYPVARKGEATELLQTALDWKSKQQSPLQKMKIGAQAREVVALSGVTDEMFPAPINKLLRGLSDGRKRGLFVLLTFLRCSGFSPDEITSRVIEWNEKNKPPLKEGYVRSQLQWHFKQRKQILPPNYDNPSFYKDLGLIDKTPETKNPLVDVTRILKKR